MNIKGITNEGRKYIAVYIDGDHWPPGARAVYLSGVQRWAELFVLHGMTPEDADLFSASCVTYGAYVSSLALLERTDDSDEA